jgi:hypothetical protein
MRDAGAPFWAIAAETNNRNALASTERGEKRRTRIILPGPFFEGRTPSETRRVEVASTNAQAIQPPAGAPD